MNKKGEIDRLSKIVRPDIGVITNIAEAHVGHFDGIFEIAKAKSEIMNNISEYGVTLKMIVYLTRLSHTQDPQQVSRALTVKHSDCSVAAPWACIQPYPTKTKGSRHLELTSSISSNTTLFATRKKSPPLE